MTAQSLIICIGNDLVADDGVGSKVYQQLLKQELPASVRLLFLGLGGLDLIEQMQGEENLIVVDAVQFGVDAGTVHNIAWKDLPHMENRPVSGHGIGVREALDICRHLYPEKMPKSCSLIGIEGTCFNELGNSLSPDVASAIPQAIKEIEQLL